MWLDAYRGAVQRFFAREKAARERRVGYALQKSSGDWSTSDDARTNSQQERSLDGNVVCPVAWRRSHVGNIRREPTPQPERREHLGSAAACLNTLTPPPWLTRRNSPNNLRLSSKSWSSVSKNRQFIIHVCLTTRKYFRRKISGIVLTLWPESRCS